MIKQIAAFISQFKSCLVLDRSLIIEKENRCFLVNRTIMNLASKDFHYAGVYLGKVKNERFFPSFPLLSMVARGEANKIKIDGKTEWLFICGRDIFGRGIINASGSIGKGDHAFVMNQHDECLGFGRIMRDLTTEKDDNRVVVKNVSDIGDFLRREQ